MNLHLYIPGHSAHAPGVRKSIVHSLVHTYWIQNTYELDFIETAQFLQNNLIAQVHQHKILDPIFLEAANQINKEMDKVKTDNEIIGKKQENLFNDKSIFLHIPYHLQDISQQRIKQIFNKICNKPDSENRLFTCFPHLKGNKMTIKKMHNSILTTKKPKG